MSKEQEFLRLIGAAVAACERANAEGAAKGAGWMVELAALAKANFEKIAEQVRAKTLVSCRGAGLGLTEALSEWEAPDYLYSAGIAVEDFYMDKW